MKNSIPFWIILLAIWIIGGSFFYQSMCCGELGAGFTIMDGSKTVASANKNLVFGFGSLTPEIPNSAEYALQKAADYLKNNPNKVLLLTGGFLASENQPNLGFSRAESVMAYFRDLGVSENQVIIDGVIDDNLVVDNDLVFNSIHYSIENIPYYELKIEDGGQFSSSVDKNLIFGRSKYNFLTPYADDIKQAFQATVDYLKANPKRMIKITGFYHASEENTSVLPDLGLARATQIKNIFQDLGMEASRIQTDSEEIEGLIFPGGNLYGGATYSFEAIPEVYDEKEEIKAIEEELKIESINLYFETDESTLSLSNNQRTYFVKLIDYLDNKSSARVNVVGHTDNAGTTSYNKDLSVERAQFIKEYLVTNGLNASQIVTVGKGEAEPIESNKTDTGKAKNRRVEVYIQ